MRIAVLSDIHANAQALEAVMSDVVNQGCEHVFCLGDIALAGPQPKDVIDYVMAQNTWTVIQGNTDKMIAQYGPEVMEFLEAQYPVMANALADDVSVINDAHRAFLAELPPILSFEVEGCTVLLTHGSPRANNEDILPGMPLEIVEEIIAGTTEKLILCGHTHVPCGYQTNTNQTVVNVGSVGRPFTPEPKSCYLKMTVTNGNCIFEHKFVEYNKETAALKLRKREFVGSNKLANTLLDPQVRHF